MIENVNKELQNCPETVFDTFDVELNLKSAGSALRDDLAVLSNLYGRINQLASNALLLYEQSKNRKEVVEGLAWSKVDSSEKVTKQKILVRTIVVEIAGARTSIVEEESRVNAYAYVYNRGRDKVKEISTMLDVGRTLLSWDKIEHSTSQY